MQVVINCIAAVAVTIAVIWIARRLIVPAWEFGGSLRDLMREAPDHVATIERAATTASHATRVAVAVSPVPALMLDAGGGAQFANAAFCARTGMAQDAVLGNGWTAALSESVRAEVSAELRKALTSGQTFDAEVLMASSGGRETPALLQCTRVGSGWLVTLTGGSQ